MKTEMFGARNTTIYIEPDEFLSITSGKHCVRIGCFMFGDMVILTVTVPKDAMYTGTKEWFKHEKTIFLLKSDAQKLTFEGIGELTKEGFTEPQELDMDTG